MLPLCATDFPILFRGRRWGGGGGGGILGILSKGRECSREQMSKTVMSQYGGGGGGCGQCFATSLTETKTI